MKVAGDAKNHSTLGGAALTTTTAAGAVTTTALGTAVNAGFASLAAQASVAMVNNGGDIGKTLQQLGSEQSVRGLLTSIVTAGALDRLDNALGFTDSAQTATGQTGTRFPLAPNNCNVTSMLARYLQPLRSLRRNNCSDNCK